MITCKGGEILDDRMQVGGKGGVVGWGVRAHEKLKNVKGKRFTVSKIVYGIQYTELAYII